VYTIDEYSQTKVIKANNLWYGCVEINNGLKYVGPWQSENEALVGRMQCQNLLSTLDFSKQDDDDSMEHLTSTKQGWYVENVPLSDEIYRLGPFKKKFTAVMFRNVLSGNAREETPDSDDECFFN